MVTTPPRIALGDRVTPAHDVRYREFDDELVMVDLQGGEYFALDAIGRRMWNELASGKSPLEVAASMATEFDATQDQIARDCLALADELIGRGLLVRRVP